MMSEHPAAAGLQERTSSEAAHHCTHQEIQAAAVHQGGPYPVGQAYAENAAMAMQQQSQEPANHLREERAPRAAQWLG